eukprot:jgi/Chrpa1/22584/Chrysochromulina_OHIO_Genome00024494-RA
MVELVVQQCTSRDYCCIGAALPGKGALSHFLGADAESWGYWGDGRITHKVSYVQSDLPPYKAGDRIRMTLAGGGNALRTVRLGGNGAWAAGDGATLAAALGAA